jgi:hypothetical protein
LTSFFPDIHAAAKKFGLPLANVLDNPGTTNVLFLSSHLYSLQPFIRSWAFRIVDRRTMKRLDKTVIHCTRSQRRDDDTVKCVGLSTAIAFVEELILLKHISCARRGSIGAGQVGKDALDSSHAQRNASLRKAQEEITSACGIPREDPVMPVLIDVHTWLNGYNNTDGVNYYHAEKIMPSLKKILRVEKFEKNSMVQPALKPGSNTFTPAKLTWVLSGELLHGKDTELNQNMLHTLPKNMSKRLV